MLAANLDGLLFNRVATSILATFGFLLLFSFNKYIMRGKYTVTPLNIIAHHIGDHFPVRLPVQWPDQPFKVRSNRKSNPLFKFFPGST